MNISFFNHSGDNIPAHADVTWEDLAKGLADVRSADCTLDNCKRSDCPSKDGHSWSAARYRPKSTRSAANVLDVHAMVIDIDHVLPEGLGSVLEKFEPYRRIITSSHSDRELDRCLRVVLATSRPVTKLEWPRFWSGTVELLGIPADSQTKDCSRLYYLPSRPNDACGPEVDGNGFAFESSEGVTLDVDAILATVPEQAPVTLSDDFEIPEFNGGPSQKAFDKAVTTLAGAWPDKGRNTAQLALCGALARAGWPVELIADFAAAVSETAHPGNGDRTKRLKSARSSVEKVQRGEFIAGWPTVEEYVDPDTVKSAMETLGMGPPRYDSNFVNAMSKAVYDTSVPGLGVLVTATRDDVHSTLKTAQRRLARSTNPKKYKEGMLIGRALEGKPFTEHPDEDTDAAMAATLQAIVRHAPRAASDLLLAEYLAKSRPDIETPALCEMIAQARSANTDHDKSELPPNEFVLETTGPRQGRPVSTSQHNFDVALRKLNVALFYDAFARKELIERTVGGSIYRETIEDEHVDKLMFEFEQAFDFFPPKDKFYAYCGYRARMSTFHPVLDYLDGNETWDGVSRAETWLIDYGKAEDTPYVRAVSKLVLVAAVRRVRQPGCKFDEMLILESPQGGFKSTAIKTLCPNPDWFADNFHLDGDTKKMIEQTSGKWIVEAGELRGMSSKDHNTLKAYLSSTIDEARMAYARKAQRLPRQFIIIGTTNDTQYLKDPTGDRRYWPVEVSSFDIEGLRNIVHQLWAEANYLDMANPHPEFIRLDPSLYEAAAQEQAKRKVENSIKVRLDDLLGDHEGRIKKTDVWKLLTDDHTPQQSLVIQASSAMHELGWKSVRSQKNKSRDSYYLRGDDSKLLVVSGNSSFGFTIKTVELDTHGEPKPEQPDSKLGAN